MPESTRLVVFDFDRTITWDHLWGKYQDAPIQDIPITDDVFVCLGRFKALVRALQHNEHCVAVATFGRRDVVEKALRHALGHPHGLSIRTPADFGHRDGSAALGDKNTQLASLAAHFCVAAGQILLVDDDQKNVEAAVKAGVAAHWVPNGLTKSVLKKIAKEIGVPTYRTMNLVCGGKAVSGSLPRTRRSVSRDGTRALQGRCSSVSRGGSPGAAWCRDRSITPGPQSRGSRSGEGRAPAPRSTGSSALPWETALFDRPAKVGHSNPRRQPSTRAGHRTPSGASLPPLARGRTRGER